MVGSRSWIGGFFHRTNTKQNDKFVDYPLTPLEVKGIWNLFCLFAECFKHLLLNFFFIWSSTCCQYYRRQRSPQTT